MTRGLLLLLAVIELALGVFGLIGATGLLVSHDAGMVLIFWPLLAAVALLLVAGAAIFVRRPWSYYLHMAIIVLMGLIGILYVGPMLGRKWLGRGARPGWNWGRAPDTPVLAAAGAALFRRVVLAKKIA